MPDPGEAGGEHMQQKAPEKLDSVEGHRPLAVSLRVIFPPESHPPLVARDQAMIRDRHTMRVAGQIFEDLRRATKRRFGIDDPFEVLQGSQELLPRLGSRQRMTVACERQAALRMALAEPGQKRRRNTRLSTRTGKKKVGRHASHWVRSGDSPPPGTTQWRWG